MMRPRIILAGALLSSAALPGCTSLGGNVSGNFACRAPDGICAPSATIDDRALALISGSDGDRLIEPAGPYVEPPREGRGFQNAAAPVRTRERVLRIVFPAQIDAAGRLHEQSAVHAVVEQGEWREELASSAVATTPREIAAATGGDTLLAAVERAEPPTIDYAGIDPDMPSDAAVAAARSGDAAKPASAPSAAASAVADPVGDIKDQVSRKLTTPRRTPAKPASTATKVSATATTPVHSDGVAPTPSPPSSAQPIATLAPVKPAAVSAAPAASAGIAVPAHATEAGKAAIASVAANPVVQGALHRAAPEAREAAKDASPLPVLKAKSFPGVQP
jgi:conjugal transfer pilus assembly protein TraV